MKIEKITDDYSVTGQIDPDQIAAVKDQGFQTIICNRPDNEGDGQPDFAQIAAAAESAGLKAVHIPFAPGGILPEHVDALRDAMDNLPKPVLAYCFTGGRAKKLWMDLGN